MRRSPLALFGSDGLLCPRCEAFSCHWRNPRASRYPCDHHEQIAAHCVLVSDHRWCAADDGCDWADRWREPLLTYADEHAADDLARPLLVVTIRTGRILPASRHSSYRTAGPARTRAGRLPNDHPRTSPRSVVRWFYARTRRTFTDAQSGPE